MKRLIGFAIILLMSSCLQVEFDAQNVEPEESLDNASGSSDLGVYEMSAPAPAVKNFHQVNNTYAQLTGVSAGEDNVLNTFQAIKVQLPTNNDPASVNGFNQIAYMRLAFAYCEKYVSNRGSELSSKSNEAIVQDLLDSFVAVDIVGNVNDKAFYEGLLSIANNEDGLLPESASSKRMAALVCASILASGYVTTM